jgi:hypothetical protein
MAFVVVLLPLFGFSFSSSLKLLNHNAAKELRVSSSDIQNGDDTLSLLSAWGCLSLL